MDPSARLIEAEAEKRMEQSLYPELKRVLFNFHHGILTLYGVVSNFHVRQIAQELVQDIEGVDITNNQLIVSTPAKQRSPILWRKPATLRSVLSTGGINSILADFESDFRPPAVSHCESHRRYHKSANGY